LEIAPTGIYTNMEIFHIPRSESSEVCGDVAGSAGSAPKLGIHVEGWSKEGKECWVSSGWRFFIRSSIVQECETRHAT
jgi:hypothetical protein